MSDAVDEAREAVREANAKGGFLFPLGWLIIWIWNYLKKKGERGL